MPNKEIKEADLQKVSGGCASDKYLPADKGEHITTDQASKHIGDFVYIVDNHDSSHFGWGKLVKVSVGKTSSGALTTYVVDIQGRQGVGEYGEIQYGEREFSAKVWTLYKQNVG